MSSHEGFVYSTCESLSQSQYNRINGGNILYSETNEQTHAVKHNALILDKKTTSAKTSNDSSFPLQMYSMWPAEADDMFSF